VHSVLDIQSIVLGTTRSSAVEYLPHTALEFHRAETTKSSSQLGAHLPVVLVEQLTENSDILQQPAFNPLKTESESESESESELELLYDWRFTANQFVLASSPLRPRTRFIFQLNTCGHSPYVISSVTRGWICRLQSLLVLASLVILRSESLRTHDHIFLSQI
jgi:hypothetical protein